MTATPGTRIAANTDIDRDVWDRDVAAAYNDRLGALVASCASWATPATLHLSRPARARYSLWSGELRLRQLEGGDLEGESGWASKMSSSVLRIAGLLHLADGHPHGEEIGVDQMDRAIAIEDLSTGLLALTTDDPYAAVGDLATASSTADGEGPPFGVLAVTNTEHPNRQNPEEADPTTLEAP